MVIANKIEQNADSLHFDALPKATLRALKKCAEINLFSRGGWYLAGGTALALQTGHRKSVDLDFFTEKKKFAEKKIEIVLSSQGKWITTSLYEYPFSRKRYISFLSLFENCEKFFVFLLS